MKIEGDLTITECYRGLLVKTGDGHTIGICERDDGFEISVNAYGAYTNNWWRVDFEKGEVVKDKPLMGESLSSESPR